MKKALYASVLAVLLAGNGLFAASGNFNGLYDPGKVCQQSGEERKFDMLRLDLKESNSGPIKPGEGEACFGPQRFAFTLGYGFGNFATTFLRILFEGAEDLKISTLGPLHFRGEIGLSEGFGVGLSVNHINVQFDWNDADTAIYWYNITYSNTSILARMNFHMNPTDKLDPYFGIGFGYKIAKLSFTSNDPWWDDWESISEPNPFGLEITGGFRYYFTPNIGFYMEAGLAKSLYQVGLAFGF